MYEEAIQTVTTVRDFSHVFDAYAQCEENLIGARIESTAELGPTEEGGDVCKFCNIDFFLICTRKLSSLEYLVTSIIQTYISRTRSEPRKCVAL